MPTPEETYGFDPFLTNPFLKAKKEPKEMIIPPKEGFKFGCDPELFIMDEKGRYVSAAGLLPGTKDAPHKVEGGAVQVDGMLGEFNIDPVSDFASFNRNIENVMKALADMLPKGYTTSVVPAVVFDEDIFDAAPDDAKELGCMPDFNAWTGAMNPPPKLPDNPRLRTASGHLHIGWCEGADTNELQHIMNCRDLVKQFDWYLGGWSVKMDDDPTRRQLYGKAGACRFKDYGVEYRVLSNFWITTRERRLAIWNRMQTAINAMARTYIPDNVNSMHNQKLQDGINSSVMDSQLAQTFRYPLSTFDARYSPF